MKSVPRVVFLDRAAFSVEVTSRTIDVPCDWIEYAETPSELVHERLKGVDAVITVGVPLAVNQLQGLDCLKFISACSTGLEHIDTKYCRDSGITVRNVSGYATIAVAEHAIAMMLLLKRSLDRYLRDVRAGEWQRSQKFSLPTHPISDLHGLTLGIFGSGAIGSAVARIAQGFGMTILHAARKGTKVLAPNRTAFDVVLRDSDIISLHCPLTPETKGLLGEREFTMMERKPVLINTARGGLVDESALVRAFKLGRISGVGVDVVSNEPISTDSPLLELVDDPHFAMTPHIAWSSRQAQQSLYDQGISHVLTFLRGIGSARPQL